MERLRDREVEIERNIEIYKGKIDIETGRLKESETVRRRETER